MTRILQKIPSYRFSPYSVSSSYIYDQQYSMLIVWCRGTYNFSLTRQSILKHCWNSFKPGYSHWCREIFSTCAPRLMCIHGGRKRGPNIGDIGKSRGKATSINTLDHLAALSMAISCISGDICQVYMDWPKYLYYMDIIDNEFIRPFDDRLHAFDIYYM